MNPLVFLLLLHPASAEELKLKEAYLKARPFEAANFENIEKLKAAPQLLDQFFDGGAAGARLEPPSPRGSSVPGPAQGLAPAAAADGAAAASVPGTPAIRFVSQKPKNFILSALWRLKGGDRGEKAYFDKIMEGFNTKTERGILVQLAAYQGQFASTQAALLREAEEEIKAAQAELDEAERGKTPEDILKLGRENLAQMRLNKEWIEKRSPEVLVSFADFSDGTQGEAGWAPEPASDGKYHVVVTFNRGLVPFYLPAAPKSVIEKGRKLTAHELSHAVDNLNPEGMGEGATEPMAYLKGARSYKEEGQPRGRSLESERKSFLELKTDLLGWMTRHLSSAGYTEEGRIWDYITSDDIRDPEAGLRWRLRVIYHRAAGPDAVLNQVAQQLQLENDVRMALATVAADPKLSEAEKPEVFIERAALAPQCRKWVQEVKATDPQEARRILKAQKIFWREYAEFIAEP